MAWLVWSRSYRELNGLKPNKHNQINPDFQLPSLAILSKLREVWLSPAFDAFDGFMLWAVASVFFSASLERVS